MKAEHKRGNAPVDRRARLVNGQYLKKAHKLDMKYNSVGGVECGPMENAIRSRGEVCGLAFGSVGEASADVHRLARVCADEIAGRPRTGANGGQNCTPSTRPERKLLGRITTHNQDD